MKNIKIEYDDDKHKYTIDDEPTVSVSKVCGILKDLGHIPKFVLENASKRGKDVHNCAELINQGKKPRVPEYIKPYIVGYKAFLAKEGYKPVPKMHEVMIISKKHNYAGRLDQLFSKARTMVVGDIKTAVKPSWIWCLQLAPYLSAVNEMGGVFISGKKGWEFCPVGPLHGRLIIQPTNFGGYSIIEEQDMLPVPASMEIFLHCQKVYEAKMKYSKNFEKFTQDPGDHITDGFKGRGLNG